MILLRYVLRELLLAFVLAFVAIVTVCTVGIIFQTFRSYEGMNAAFLLRIAPLALAEMSPWAMIVAVCLATTLVYGRLSADNEIDAMRTAGLHTNRILLPAVVFGGMLCLGALILHWELAPRARQHRRTLLRETILLVLRHPPSGKQHELKIGKLNRLSYADAKEGRLIQPALLVLNKKDQGRPQLLFVGREGRLEIAENKPPAILMEDGSLTDWDSDAPPGRPPQVRTDGKMQNPQAEFDLAEIFARSSGPEDMSAVELAAFAESAHGRLLAEAVTELHVRFARSLAPLVLVFLCVPIGILVRKGSRLAGMGAALPPLIGYIVLMVVFQTLGAKDLLPPALAAYGAIVVPGAVAGVFLTRLYRT